MDTLDRIDTLLNNDKFKSFLIKAGKNESLGRFIGISFGFITKQNYLLATYSKGHLMIDTSNFPNFTVIGITTIYKP